MKRRSFLRIAGSLPLLAAGATSERALAAEVEFKTYVPLVNQADTSRITYVRYTPTPTSEICVSYATGGDPFLVIPQEIALVSSPAWSPDGTSLAFSLAPAIEPWPADLVVVQSDGTGLQRLTNNSGQTFVTDISWSHDGSRIAFSSNQTGKYQIYITNKDGSQTTRLWESDHNDFVLGWSIDGQYVVFRSELSLEDSQIHRILPGSSNAERVTEVSQGLYGTNWSPDGTKVAFSEVVGTQFGGPIARIFTINIDGTGKKQISDTDQSRTHGGPVWSPDGRQIAYTESFMRFSSIYITNANGNGERRWFMGNRVGTAAWTR